ncbi:MAG: glutamate racemase [Micavibrio aeruginosavorus]|uniref:Glutamate racemase n=1 Tax=Micavibrio aeruginosavorus TaxID=349221 RepID=A0A2W5FN93_9BACT|nr:MAG: glutamate racemase [Micavibrio aeruginosavorus]
MPKNLEPIGVFDSGIGGLTVLKALQEKYPNESYVYIGDTARLPYGTKSPETIIRYSQALTREILKHNIKAIVVACNTASTHALSAVREMADGIPVLGMIDPASRAAIAATKNDHIAVVATYGTVKSGAYEKAIKDINSSIQVSSQACQLLVALAEEGWASDKIAEDALRKYLEPIFDGQNRPDTLILGCTHFPLFEKQIRDILGPDVTLINSGEAAAAELNISPHIQNGTCQFFATDDPARFAANAAKFFGSEIYAADVELIDI